MKPQREKRNARFRQEPCFWRALFQLVFAQTSGLDSNPCRYSGVLSLASVRRPRGGAAAKIHTFVRSLTRSELLEQFKGVAVKTVQCSVCPDCANLFRPSGNYCCSFIIPSVDTEKGWMCGSGGENPESCRNEIM